MADRIVKPDTGNDLVLQNDDASAKIEINEAGTIVHTGTSSIDVSGGTFTTSSAQKQAIVQAGPGSGTLDVSSGTFTSSTAQKTAIVDGGKGNLAKGDVGLGNVTNESKATMFTSPAFTGTASFSGSIDQADGENIQTDEIRARDGDGLKLRDSGGSDGIFVENGGQVGIGTDSPGNQLHVSGDSNYLLKLEQTGTVIHMMALRSNGAGLDFACDGANNRSIINSIGSGDDLLLKVQDGAHELKIASDGKLFSLPTYNNTTSGGANVFILHTTGEFHRSTSSRQYKTNIVDTAKGLNELLTLRPVDFTSLCKSDDLNKLRTGLIAEEVAEAGFEEYTVRDENQEIQSVEYAHMVTLCIKAIQELSAKVSLLEKS